MFNRQTYAKKWAKQILDLKNDYPGKELHIGVPYDNGRLAMLTAVMTQKELEGLVFFVVTHIDEPKEEDNGSTTQSS